MKVYLMDPFNNPWGDETAVPVPASIPTKAPSKPTSPVTSYDNTAFHNTTTAPVSSWSEPAWTSSHTEAIPEPSVTSATGWIAEPVYSDWKTESVPVPEKSISSPTKPWSPVQNEVEISHVVKEEYSITNNTINNTEAPSSVLQWQSEDAWTSENPSLSWPAPAMQPAVEESKVVETVPDYVYPGNRNTNKIEIQPVVPKAPVTPVTDSSSVTKAVSVVSQWASSLFTSTKEESKPVDPPKAKVNEAPSKPQETAPSPISSWPPSNYGVAPEPEPEMKSPPPAADPLTAGWHTDPPPSTFKPSSTTITKNTSIKTAVISTPSFSKPVIVPALAPPPPPPASVLSAAIQEAPKLPEALMKAMSQPALVPMKASASKELKEDLIPALIPTAASATTTNVITNPIVLDIFGTSTTVADEEEDWDDFEEAPVAAPSTGPAFEAPQKVEPVIVDLKSPILTSPLQNTAKAAVPADILNGLLDALPALPYMASNQLYFPVAHGDDHFTEDTRENRLESP